MAKIKHNNGFDTLRTIIDDAKQRGLIQLLDQSKSFNGEKYTINDRKLINFGYCGYLGLEMHQELKKGAISLIENYGLQYGVSRAYITSKPEEELLNLLSNIYKGCPIIVQSSTSSSHIANLPNLVESEDVIILDQQVHFSVQTGAQLCRQKGVPIEMIRHNNLKMLARKYESLEAKHDRIWYLIDGVYSMFGDTAPIDELKCLLKKYPKLHIYADDAHGMSWTGEHGCGYFFSKMGVHPRVVLNTTMGKGFGVTGGIAVYPTQELYEKVKVFGGPLTYSHPLSPAIMGAGIASAQLHLSNQFSEIQNELKAKIAICHQELENSGLPIMSNSETPIFFLGLGQPKTAYNMVQRLFNDGFYANAALYPAVPIKCSGIRFSISRHNSIEDIKSLVKAIKHHYPLVLAEEGITDEKVRRAFKLPILKVDTPSRPINVSKPSGLRLKYTKTIEKVDKQKWNECLGEQGTYDWDGMKFLEDVFSSGNDDVNNWKFHYLLVMKGQEVVAATFLTETLVKDDIFAKESISEQIEKKRKDDPRYLVSPTLMMGSLMTDGEHFFLNDKHENWRRALELIVQQIDTLQERTGTTNVILRDFFADTPLAKYIFEKGYVKIDLPNANTLTRSKWNSVEEFIGDLKSNHRWHFKQDILPYLDKYTVKVEENASNELIEHCHKLFLNVKERNIGINLFDFPLKLFKTMFNHPKWEVVNLYVKEEELPVASIWSYKTPENYSPLLIGMNYDYLHSHKLYKQTLFRMIERGNQLGYAKIFLGLSADLEKRKLGAIAEAKVAFVRSNDNFSMNVMESMAILTEKVA